MSLTFNLAMLVMLLCVAALYYIQTRLKRQDIGAAKNSLIILAVDCLLYFAAFLASCFSADRAVIWLDTIAVLVGAFLPFFIRGKFNISIISFPHLVERFELITIITFGEGVVGMTDFFDAKIFSLRPILVFAVILVLFGCYVTQIHYLCNHHRTDRALRLMFSHYFIVISVNLITVGFKFLDNREAGRMFTMVLMTVCCSYSIVMSSARRMFTMVLMTAALILFFASVFANSVYYHDRFSLTVVDVALSVGSLVTGAAAAYIFRNSIYGFLIGILVAVSGNFGMLIYKYKDGAVHNEEF